MSMPHQHLSPQAATDPKAQILIADFNQNNQQIITQQLASEPYHLIYAKSMAEIISLAKTYNLSVIVIDLSNLELEEVTQIRILKEWEVTKHTPLIFLSHQPLTITTSIDQCQGCIDYIYKPYEPQVLRDKISGFLAVHRQLHAVKRPDYCHNSLVFNVVQNDDKDIYALNRMRLVTKMSAAIAHEIRNPLSIIRALLELARIANKPLPQDKIDLMVHEVDRANDIVKNFLSTLKEDQTTMKPTQLNILISELQSLLDFEAAQYGTRINYQLEDCCETLINSHQISQVIINLVLNALQAMEPNGGCIEIKTHKDHQGIRLLISDQGKGIPSKILSSIWKPFFTTKKTGTGLGLPLCKSIIESHLGDIEVVSNSEGTTFMIHLPPA